MVALIALASIALPLLLGAAAGAALCRLRGGDCAGPRRRWSR
ncbi:MAG: hypothetical protein U0802_18020 [Candidatus Binatia bacterium]